MDTFDAIYARRSIKAFDAEHRMPEEDLNKLLEAAIQAPDQLQHPALAVRRRCDDPDLRAKIRTEFGNDQAQMTDASLLVLLTADVKAWAKEPERYWKKRAGRRSPSCSSNWMGPFHEGREWLQRDEAQRSIGMAMPRP